jgi:xanthine dehydrogenase small subunit
MMINRQVLFYINNDEHEIKDSALATETLAEYLRKNCELNGTKIVCAEGDCGACSVLIRKENKYQSINSCIVPLFNLDGAHVITVEGIQDRDKLHPVQEKMIECQGAQCGYCTPGFICAMTGMVDELKKENKPITEKKARNYLTGNLCRCTGYQPIINAALKVDLNSVTLQEDKYQSTLEHLKSQKRDQASTVIEDTIYLPHTLGEAIKLKESIPGIRICAGATDLGVVVNKGKSSYQKILHLQKITELNNLHISGDQLHVGANISLSKFENFIQGHLPHLKELLHIFASPQIKNQGTIIGNMVNASPIGDTIPFLLITDSVIQVESLMGKRSIPLKDFYQGYKKIDLKSNEIVTGITISLPNKKDFYRLYKVSTRKDLDISTVTFAILKTPDKCRLALGGVGPTVSRIEIIENKLANNSIDQKLINDLKNDLTNLIHPLSDLRASKEYRLKVAQNFLQKFFDEYQGAAT